MHFRYALSKYVGSQWGCILVTALFLLLCVAGECVAAMTVVYPSDGPAQVRMAAKEVRRYVYLTTGKLLPIVQVRTLPLRDDLILVVEDGTSLLKELQGLEGAKAPRGGYYLKTTSDNDRHVLVIAGAGPAATLHGAYRFAEHLGIRFYLHGDTIPDDRKDLRIAGLDEVSMPVFETRGIIPFHNFPEGPDWWNTDDYRVVISQLSKMGMNFIGLHWYPRWGHGEKNEQEGPEPTVWIGLPEDVREGGTVAFSYPSFYAHTERPGRRWGFVPVRTEAFHGGTAQLFDKNGFGPTVMDERMPDFADQESCHRVFERTGEMFRNAFTHARHVGVKTCLGTEIPLGLETKSEEVPRNWVRGIPPEVQRHLKDLGKDPTDSAVVKEVYRGIFKRIMKTHPLDYYWLWTYEMWGDFGLTPRQLADAKTELQLVHELLREMNAPFKLALCGWRPGTPDDPAAFDAVLPKNVPFAALWDEAEGFEDLDEERVKWPGTWLEEDWGLVQPQLEVHRVYDDVKAAYRKRCHGMLAKHWRTRVLGPNIGALSSLLWFRGPTGTNPGQNLPRSRNDWIDEFYADWARQSFGPEAAGDIAAIFAGLDKAGESGLGALPHTTGWEEGGPGAIVANYRSWKAESKKYEFIDKLASLRPRISGAGNLGRFDYWLNTFKCLRIIGEFGCLRGQLEEAVGRDEYSTALRVRIEMARLWERLMSSQVQRVTNSSELGEIANLEQLTWNSIVVCEWDRQLTDAMERRLPNEAEPSALYSGPARMVVTPRRSQVYSNEVLKLKILTAGDVRSPTLHWRPLGGGRFQSKPLTHVARGVYTVSLNSNKDDFEYYVQAVTSEGEVLFPATAPEICQSVVVLRSDLGFRRSSELGEYRHRDPSPRAIRRAGQPPR